jgi:flagellar assembly protein FliH
MMSLSNVIRSGTPQQYRIDAFDVQDLGTGTDPLDFHEGETVCLPVGKISSTSSGAEERERPESQDPESEESLKDRMASLEREAYEKGFEQGHKDGLALEQRQMEEKGKQLESLFSGLLQLKEQIFAESEKEMLDLSILIAKQIIRTHVEQDPHVIERSIRAAYKYLVDKSKVRIRICSDDMEEVRKMLPELASITKGGRFQVVEDDAMKPGGCILETGFGNINASIEDQLWMIEKEIREVYDTSSGESTHAPLP